MSTQPPTNQRSRLRCRVVVELDPDELVLLDRATERHGTKRAAIVAALIQEARTLTAGDGAPATHPTRRRSCDGPGDAL